MSTRSDSPVRQITRNPRPESARITLTLGVYFTGAFRVSSFWTSVFGYAIDGSRFTVPFYVMAVSYVGAAMQLLPTREGRGLIVYRETRDSRDA